MVNVQKIATPALPDRVGGAGTVRCMNKFLYCTPLLLLVAACAATPSADPTAQPSTPSSAPVGTPASIPPGAVPTPAPPAEVPDTNLGPTETFAKTLVGKTLPAAQAATTGAGYTLRVVSVNGKPNAVTMDLRTDRVNVEVVKNVVTRAFAG